LDRVGIGGEDDWNRCGRGLGRQCRRHSERVNHGDLTADQRGRERLQSVALDLSPAVFERHVAALDIAGFAQALAECRPRRPRAEDPDHRQLRLLRVRREHPDRERRRRRAAEKRGEVAPPYWTELHLIPRCEDRGMNLSHFNDPCAALEPPGTTIG
jgi:hypothetical protein